MQDRSHRPGTGAAGRSGSGLTLRTGRAVYPILRIWDEGLALPAEAGADLRGRVDVYDGARHVFHALVVATADDTPGDGASREVRCSFKRCVPAGITQPRDYADADLSGDPADATG